MKHIAQGKRMRISSDPRLKSLLNLGPFPSNCKRKPFAPIGCFIIHDVGNYFIAFATGLRGIAFQNGNPACFYRTKGLRANNAYITRNALVWKRGDPNALNPERPQGGKPFFLPNRRITKCSAAFQNSLPWK